MQHSRERTKFTLLMKNTAIEPFAMLHRPLLVNHHCFETADVLWSSK